ncbi:hypothetical protein ACIPJK_06770 [Streptomyces roseus]|uniref:hypothetical protein n=1 Tax=Streptomyces roseus TaxID=66430 RepID=UPI0037F6D0DF
MGERADRDHEREAVFDQRGQHVNGPQYNADQINISESVSPETLAEGLRRYHETPRRPRRRGVPWDPASHRTEEADLKAYGNRHYSRDRDRWLRSLPLGERMAENRREASRLFAGKAPAHHRRILRAADLPPDASPADPRYLRAKKEVEQGEYKRARQHGMAVLAVLLVVVVACVVDGSYGVAAFTAFLAVLLGRELLQSRP